MVNVVEPKAHDACLICLAPVTIHHFGVQACRACADFFRRSPGKHYICRQGTNNCDLTKNGKYKCKSCRYAKCVQAGMSLTGFEGEVCKICANDEHTARSHEHGEPMQPETPIITHIPVESFSEVADAASTDLPLLRRIEQSYKLMCSVRRTSELANSTVPGSSHLIFGRLNKLPMYTPASYDQFNSACRIAIIALYEFAEAAFIGFGELSDEDKLNVIRGGSCPIFQCETIQRTLKEFPNDDEVLIVSATHYMRKGAWEGIHAGAANEACRREAEELMAKWMSDIRRLIFPLVIEAAMEDTEFYGYIGLAFWSIANGGRSLSEQAYAMAECFRKQLFRELHLYYKHHRGISNYADKLGKIMFLLSTCQEFTANMHGQIDLFRLVDLIPEDNFSFQFHMRI